MDFSFILLFIYSLFAIIITLVLFFLPFKYVEKKSNSEKLSAYECGFMPFDDARGIFDIKFYLVSMLFLIFDLEILFLFPWTLGLFNLSFEYYLSIILFLGCLFLGYLLEWRRGALEWNDF